MAIDFLRQARLLCGAHEREHAWLANRLSGSDLHHRRRIASYVAVTAEGQATTILDSLVRRFQLCPPSFINGYGPVYSYGLI